MKNGYEVKVIRGMCHDVMYFLLLEMHKHKLNSKSCIIDVIFILDEVKITCLLNNLQIMN